MKMQSHSGRIYLLLLVALLKGCWSSLIDNQDDNQCGYQITKYDSLNTVTTTLFEFPWTAILLYENSQKQAKSLCSGSLIKNRYVLTAANCFTNRQGRQLSAVRLGEHNVNTSKDCFENQCSEPPRDYIIEEIIVHPNYSSESHSNDVALLRLNDTVTFSNSIRPICLPSADITLPKSGDTLIISGWGINAQGGALAETKKKVLTKLITNEECIKNVSMYQKYLTENHLCTLELANTTQHSCAGDSGAPVMFLSGKRWYQEGIASFGIGCNLGKPDVHTKVFGYLDWIKENTKLI